MAIYEYRCNNCEKIYEVSIPISKYKFDDLCIYCNKHTSERIIGEPIVVSCGPQTLGTLAEKNTAQMGKYELEDKRANLTQEKQQAADYIKGHKVIKPTTTEKPWYQKANSTSAKKIRSMTPTQQKKFIHEGK